MILCALCFQIVGRSIRCNENSQNPVSQEVLWVSVAVSSNALSYHSDTHGNIILRVAPTDTSSHQVNKVRWEEMFWLIYRNIFEFTFVCLQSQGQISVQDGLESSTSVLIISLLCWCGWTSVSQSHKKKLIFCAAELLSHQEKLAKSIHYLISKEDQVRTQITELELLINQTEVRELTHAAATPTSFFTLHQKWALISLSPKNELLLQILVYFFRCFCSYYKK